MGGERVSTYTKQIYRNVLQSRVESGSRGADNLGTAEVTHRYEYMMILGGGWLDVLTD